MKSSLVSFFLFCIFWFLSISLFAQTSETLVFNSSYSPPYSREDGSGILDTILTEACASIGLEAVIQMMPAERALRGAETGEADGVVARVDGIDSIYPSLRQVPEATIEARDFVAFSLRPDIDVRSWDELAGYNVAYVRGWKIVEANLPNGAVPQPVGSTEQAFLLLKKGRTDIVINARLDGLRMAQILDLPAVKVQEPPLISLKLYPYLNRSRAEWVEPLADALRRLKESGRFDQIYREALADLVSVE